MSAKLHVSRVHECQTTCVCSRRAGTTHNYVEPADFLHALSSTCILCMNQHASHTQAPTPTAFPWMLANAVPHLATVRRKLATVVLPNRARDVGAWERHRASSKINPRSPENFRPCCPTLVFFCFLLSVLDACRTAETPLANATCHSSSPLARQPADSGANQYILLRPLSGTGPVPFLPWPA